MTLAQAMLRLLRKSRQHVPRVSVWCFSAAVPLTALSFLVASLAPSPGLTRSYYYPIALGADPTDVEADSIPAVETTASNVDLAFIDEENLPNRYYLVRWRGVWFSPRPERIVFHAGADDGVIVRVDGATVIERNPAVGMSTAVRSVELTTGAHRLEIVHWQHGGGNAVNVRWTLDGAEADASGTQRVFLTDPGLSGYLWMLVSVHVGNLALLIWMAGAAILFGPVACAYGRMVLRTVSSRIAEDGWDRLRTVSLPAFVGPSQVLLFGPWTVHTTNRSEFLLPFGSLAPNWLWLLVLVVGGLSALGLVLPRAWFPRYVAALCAVGVLLWIQGNLLLAEYGVLDGTGLDLELQAWRLAFEACIWVGVVGSAVFFARPVTRTAPTASGLLVSVQTAALLLPALAPVGRPTLEATGASGSWQLPPTEIYEFSNSRNIIHIVLDMFPSRTLTEIRETDPLAFDLAWSGFTFYPNNLGAFPVTMTSMPAMLTGVPYRNQARISSYRQEHPSVFHVLGQHGYRLRSLTADSRDHPVWQIPGADGAIRYTIPAPYGSYRDYVDSTSAQLLDLSLFRHAPHSVKDKVYRNGKWLLQEQIALRRGGAATAWRALGDTAFLMELAASIEPRGDSPVYSFLHLITPHPPIVTDADCAYVAGRPALTRTRYLEQARCALSAVETLFDRLRALDLYDRSAIVVTSDHGIPLFAALGASRHRERSPSGKSMARIMLDATPLLLIKPLGAQGPLKTSPVPTATSDLPATLLDLAGLPNTLERGTSVLALDPARSRERTYAEHSWEPRNNPGSQHIDVLHIFSVNGQVDNPDAWRYKRAIFGPMDDREAQYLTHRIGMSEGREDAAGPPGRRIYTTDDYAAFFLRSDTERIAFDLRLAPGSPPRTVTVRVDGELIGRYPLSDAWRRADIPVDARDTDASPFCIELLTNPVGHDGDGAAQGVMLRGDF